MGLSHHGSATCASRQSRSAGPPKSCPACRCPNVIAVVQHVPVIRRLRWPGPHCPGGLSVRLPGLPTATGAPGHTWPPPPTQGPFPSLPPAPRTHATAAAQQACEERREMNETWHTSRAQACGPCMWARPVRPVMPWAPAWHQCPRGAGPDGTLCRWSPLPRTHAYTQDDGVSRSPALRSGGCR